MPKTTVAELETTVAVHETRLKSVETLASETNKSSEQGRREHAVDIAALKAEVATLKHITYGALLIALGAHIAVVLKK